MVVTYWPKIRGCSGEVAPLQTFKCCMLYYTSLYVHMDVILSILLPLVTNDLDYMYTFCLKEGLFSRCVHVHVLPFADLG